MRAELADEGRELERVVGRGREAVGAVVAILRPYERERHVVQHEHEARRVGAAQEAI